jgi:hypothetical protein
MFRSRKKRWIVIAGIAAATAVGGLYVAGRLFAKRLDPYIREQAMQYLQHRFDSNVEIGSLKIRFPGVSPVRVLLARGRGSVARAEATSLVLKRRDAAPTDPPLFLVDRCVFEVDLGTLWSGEKRVKSATLEGVEIRIPPRRGGVSSRPADGPAVIIDRIAIRNATLYILPKNPAKVPLEFQIHRLNLESSGAGAGMRYDAELTNAKPPGKIQSKGTFGPWVAAEPGDTPLAGDYTFNKANLGVFKGIAGTLSSSGAFDGTLSAIHAKGQATVPDFRLKKIGNRVALATTFEVEVDGTNGNTILKPVRARLGRTEFTTSGGVIKHEAAQRRVVSLNVSMPKGHLEDLLRLGMKEAPFMEGLIALKTRIDLPPLSGDMREKLILDGDFKVLDGRFLRSTIQDQIDGLSRRGQGQPKNQEIDEVVSQMSGKFHLQNEEMEFRNLSFTVPGAEVAIAGNYSLENDVLDFHGTLRLQARVSQTMTGWKRWALKPVDPIFAKDGAGTLLRIKIVGTSKGPKFGLDRENRASLF